MQASSDLQCFSCLTIGTPLAMSTSCTRVNMPCACMSSSRVHMSAAHAHMSRSDVHTSLHSNESVLEGFFFLLSIL